MNKQHLRTLLVCLQVACIHVACTPALDHLWVAEELTPDSLSTGRIAVLPLATTASPEEVSDDALHAADTHLLQAIQALRPSLPISAGTEIHGALEGLEPDPSAAFAETGSVSREVLSDLGKRVSARYLVFTSVGPPHHRSWEDEEGRPEEICSVATTESSLDVSMAIFDAVEGSLVWESRHDVHINERVEGACRSRAKRPSVNIATAILAAAVDQARGLAPPPPPPLEDLATEAFARMVASWPGAE